MEYKVSGMNWLCARTDSKSVWIPVFPLEPDQLHELKQVEQWLERRSRTKSDDRSSLVKSVDILYDH